jgi:hypothetical protein
MTQLARKAAFARAVALAALTIGIGGVALGDDNPPPANPAPDGRHNNPAWIACKKKADDQNLPPGDARHEFMKTCLKSAKSSATAPATS